MKPFESIRAFYTVEIHNKDGSLVLKKTRRCDSLLANWIIMQFAAMGYTKVVPFRDEASGDLLTYGMDDSRSLNGGGGVGNVDAGILVGTGTNVVTIGDYQLQTKILHGTTAGKLSYGGCGAVLTVIVGNTSYYGWQRAFANTSGGTITVNEIGATVSTASSPNFHAMILRDVVAPLAVNNGQTLTVTYKITTSVIYQSQSGVDRDSPWSA